MGSLEASKPCGTAQQQQQQLNACLGVVCRVVGSQLLGQGLLRIVTGCRQRQQGRVELQTLSVCVALLFNVRAQLTQTLQPNHHGRTLNFMGLLAQGFAGGVAFQQRNKHWHITMWWVKQSARHGGPVVCRKEVAEFRKNTDVEQRGVVVRVVYG